MEIELSDLTTGRKILSYPSIIGDIVILTWTNSQFRLTVTEVYKVRGEFLEQTGITFHDPHGKEPPLIKPDEVGDFYHTGEPFRTEDMSRQFKKIVFRIGEIGDPVLKIGGSHIRLKEEVGFGGAVVLEIKDQR